MFETLAFLFSHGSNLSLINSVGTRVLCLTSLPTWPNSFLRNYTCKTGFDVSGISGRDVARVSNLLELLMQLT